MMRTMCKKEYEQWIASTRDERMAWFREARFGIFVHYGLYSQLGRGEWAQVSENIPVDEYAKLADTFAPKPGAPREWAKLAKEAGAKYMVMTTRHHEGFSLWDSKVNPFNSVNYGPHRDIVREFVDACREFDLKIGLYTSMVDWHHPDGGICAYDLEARKRFLDYLEALNVELLTQYGKIDILWYDGPWPMDTYDGWDSVGRNQRLRAIQPHIILNNRSYLPEDLVTPEGHVTPEGQDWEACMTFNDISWGYVDEKQALAHAYTAPRILKMLNTCVQGGGNLLLNIGPKPDGSVPADAIEPLLEVGRWLKRNGSCVYGRKKPFEHEHVDGWNMGNSVCGFSGSADGKTICLWNWIWPERGEMGIGGYVTAPKRVYLLADGTDLDFEHKGQRIVLKNLPKTAPDPTGVTIICMEFDQIPEHHVYSYYPHMNRGYDWAGENKI